MPLPREDTTPPVIKTYDVMDSPVVGGNNKGLDQKHLARDPVLFSNPWKYAPSLDVRRF
jgi:hypothetical protein